MKITFNDVFNFLPITILVLAILTTGCSSQSANTDSNGLPNNTGPLPVASQADKQTLDLSNQYLTSLPLDVTNNTQITKLILSDNALTSLPSQIGKLTNLEKLYLDNNNLQGSLVAELRQMAKLRILSASNNNLTGIPAEIGQLTRLETINFSHNQLDSMPMEIKNIKNNLKTFNLAGNKYTPQQISALRATLPKTQIIN